MPAAPQPLDPLNLPLEGVRLIEASAGTGKTYTIAALYLRLLLEKRLSVRDLLVVTYTRAATEELRDRIRARLREALAALRGATCGDDLLAQLIAAQPDPRATADHLERQITCLDEAAVFTIHGFCQRMLQDNAFESGALFDAELITSEAELLDEVVRDFWRRRFYAAGEGVAALAREQWGTPDGLRAAIRTYIARPDLQVAAGPAPAPDAYGRLFAELQRLWRAEREDILALIAGSQALSRAKDAYKEVNVAAATAALDAFVDAAPVEYALPDGITLFTTTMLCGAVTKSAAKKGLGAPVHRLFDLCDELVALRTAQARQLTAEAIAWCRDELPRRKEALGVLAFDDLLSRLSDALDPRAGDSAAELADRIAGRFRFALIDEFQDTDPAQYRIFETVYANRPGCGLLLIGDPKQAIYSFRGADVFTYMAAKAAVPAANHYTLGRNWRSTARLVGAVNALFARNAAAFLFPGEIDYFEVEAAGHADNEPLRIDGEVPAPLNAWFLPRQNDKPMGKGAADALLAAACAREVTRLLQAGAEGRALIGEQPLLPKDIAVLVRSHSEAAQVQAALRGQGITSVFFSRDSVYNTEEAAELARLLAAVAEPGSESLLRGALCSRLLGLSLAGFDALLADELAWEELAADFHRYHRLWLERGFMAMFRRLLEERGIARRLLALTDGERRLTNLLQLAELLQNASREHHGIEGVLRWLAGECARPDGDSEEQQLRLESDEELVKIVTIHRSKGLEYPVVFAPFLWKCRLTGDGPLLFHDERRALTLDLAGGDANRARVERERLAEDVRLAYVALTRARHLCWFAWGALRDAPASALAWLLHGTDDLPDVEALAQRVGALADEELRQGLEAFAAHGLTVAPLPGEMPPWRGAEQTACELQAREPGRAIAAEWRVTSYSALTAGAHADSERPEYGSEREDTETEGTPAEPIFAFPRGAHAGRFMHALFEGIDFAAPLDGQFVARQLARHGFDPAWQPCIEGMVRQVLATDLDGDGLRLESVARDRRLDELEFHYPLARLAPDELNAAIDGLGAFTGGPRLTFAPQRGMMRGFIDLIFEHRGRYYLLDYKSNHLGPRLEHYARDRLDHAMAEQRYDLQYLIYTVALHRWLRRRLPAYDYGRHFGGVYYLFLRGMRAGHGAGFGVWHDLPPLPLIERLDALFGGGE